jgi:uncharacterized protein YjiS (DUF1127 family)
MVPKKPVPDHDPGWEPVFGTRSCAPWEEENRQSNKSEETMTNGILPVRDVRALLPAITPPFSTKRAAARLRRLWRGYRDRQVRRAVAVMLHALDDRTLADLGINRDEVEALVRRPELSPPRRFTASPQ